MAKRTTGGSTAKGRVQRVSTAVRNGSISQTGIRKELANQRKAFGAAGQKRAMKNWGLREGKAPKGAKGARGGKTIIGGKVG